MAYFLLGIFLASQNHFHTIEVELFKGIRSLSWISAWLVVFELAED
jgi:hypothetical protein